jgi:hypothetical protein
MNNIQRGHVTCYMEDISVLRSFGEGQGSSTEMGALGASHLGTGDQMSVSRAIGTDITERCSPTAFEMLGLDRPSHGRS